MAGSTLSGSGEVKQHLLALNPVEILVAGAALDALMRAFQGERSLFVIERRWRPLYGAVALLAARVGAVARELARMHILMADLAVLQNRLERDMPHAGLSVGRLVAIDAGHGSVRADQRVIRLIVIEAGEVLPILDGMAGFASRNPPIVLVRGHLCFELPKMNIFVAGGTSQVPKMEGSGRLGLALLRGVTIGAGHRQMRSFENKAGFQVPREGERRRRKGLRRMATLAAVRQRGCGELPGMFVLVAISAQCEVDFVPCRRTLGNMALCASDLGVRSLERVVAGAVILHGKGRGLPAIHGVAGLALAAVFALGKLAAVRIGSVAIRAELVGNGRLQVAAVVACLAMQVSMLSEQREVSLVMIELRAYSRDLLPAGG